MERNIHHTHCTPEHGHYAVKHAHVQAPRPASELMHGKVLKRVDAWQSGTALLPLGEIPPSQAAIVSRHGSHTNDEDRAKQ